MIIPEDNNDLDLPTNERRRNQLIRLKINAIHLKDKSYLIKIIAWCFLSENMKIKLRKGLQNQMKTVDRFIALFLFIGFLTNLIQDFLYFNYNKVKSEGTITIIVKGIPTSSIQICRFITTFTTAISLILLPFHYKIERYLLIIKNERSMHNKITFTVSSSLSLVKMIIIVIVTIIHAPPYYDGYYVTISTTDNIPKQIQVDVLMFINVLVPLRWLFTINYFALYSIFADDRADKICEESMVTRDIFFSFKSQLKYRPLSTFLLLFLSSVFLFGYMLRNTEVSFMVDVPLDKFQDWTEVMNGFWCILLSFFTIGYGDLYPQTVFGRIIMSVSCLWGLFLVGLLIIYLSSHFVLSNNERKVVDEVMRDEVGNKRKKIALEVIYAFYCFNKMTDANYADYGADGVNKAMKAMKQLDCIQMLIRRQKAFRLEEAEEKVQSTITHLLDKFNTKVNIEIDALIKRTRNEIESTKSKIKASKSIQSRISKYSKTVLNMTRCLYECIDNRIEGGDQSNMIQFEVNDGDGDGDDNGHDIDNRYNAIIH